MKNSRSAMIQYRRCHVCGHVSHVAGPPESAHNVKVCGQCQKHFAPFYYFNDRVKPVPADLALRPPLLEGERFPIQGLTAYWESF